MSSIRVSMIPIPDQSRLKAMFVCWPSLQEQKSNPAFKLHLQRSFVLFLWGL